MMDDLLSREEVIKAIKDEWDGCSGEYNSACIIRDTCEAIDRVASAQPEIKTDEDTISRQAAIDAVLKLTYADGAYGYTDAKDLVDSLENLPSAQPEIIHCKDCRWWDKFGDYDNGYCMAAKHGYFSKHWEISIKRKYKGDFYCADAEL